MSKIDGIIKLCAAAVTTISLIVTENDTILAW